MRLTRQVMFCISTLLAAWLGMQQVHELGHVLGAYFTGGTVERVVLHPFGFSRTDVAHNPAPLAVAWAGPVFGVMAPVVLWLGAAKGRMPGAFVWRFFAGFCLIANGAYLAFGSFDRIGDCGDMLRHGAPMWTLWLFGAVCMPFDLWLWNGLAPQFGIGAKGLPVEPRVAYGVTAIAAGMLLVSLVVGE